MEIEQIKKNKREHSGHAFPLLCSLLITINRFFTQEGEEEEEEEIMGRRHRLC